MDRFKHYSETHLYSSKNKYFSDLKNPKTNKKTPGFTIQERESFTKLLDSGLVDSYRHLYPEETSCYTFWSYMMNARAKGNGW